MIINPSEDLKIISRYQNRYQLYGIDPKSLGWNKGKQDLRYHALISRLPNNLNTFIDIGCGFADGYLYIQKKFENISYYGVDIVPQFVEIAKKRFKEGTFFCGNYINYQPTKKIDCLLASGLFNYKNKDNYSEIENLFKYCKKHNIRYCSFDILSDNVEYKEDNLFYYNINKIAEIISRYTRRFEIGTLYQPFEMNITCDFESKINKSLSKYMV